MHPREGNHFQFMIYKYIYEFICFIILLYFFRLNIYSSPESNHINLILDFIIIELIKKKKKHRKKRKCCQCYVISSK